MSVFQRIAFASLLALVSSFSLVCRGQVDVNSLLGIPQVSNAELSGLGSAAIGSLLYNTDEGALYVYRASGWQAIAATDEQKASQVDLDNALDANGDGNEETTVGDVLQGMVPIVSKAARVFYPPSISIDVSTTGNGRSKNLYSEYISQFGTPQVASAGAPSAIPTYDSDELYYYVTYYDTSIFSNVSVSASGVMTYNVIDVPAGYNTLINVVFVVK